MPGTRKLGRTTDQRMAMLRNQVSELLWYGQLETTLDRADIDAIVKKICDGLEITILQFFDCPLFENLEQEIR